AMMRRSRSYPATSSLICPTRSRSWRRPAPRATIRSRRAPGRCAFQSTSSTDPSFRLSLSRRSSIAATWWWRSAPVVRPRCGREVGVVTFVDAGAGEADLLTLRALHALQNADAVFHAGDVAPAILDRARRDAERVVADGREIKQHLLEAARAGRRVVRVVCGE